MVHHQHRFWITRFHFYVDIIVKLHNSSVDDTTKNELNASPSVNSDLDRCLSF